MKDLIIYGNTVKDTIHLYQDEFILGVPNNDCHIIDSIGGVGNHESTIELTGLELNYSIQSVSDAAYDT